MNKSTLAALAAAGCLLFPFGAEAQQMGTRPYSFDASGRTGMSTAARQAIIRQELFGVTPSVLLKSEDGRLLRLRKGPGSTAFVRSPSGEILPSYRGRRIKRELGAGEFNGFFAGSDGITPPPYSSGSSGETIDSWTGNVISGRPSGGYGSLDQWTSMVYLLDP